MKRHLINKLVGLAGALASVGIGCAVSSFSRLM